MSEPSTLQPNDELDLPEVAQRAFALSHEAAPGSVTVRLIGSADSDVAPALGTFFERLHAEVVRTHRKEVVLDFRDLQFLTSSCIKYLVVAITRMTAAERASRYELRLVTAAGLRWQELSFQVLRQMAPGLVRIEQR